MLPEAKECLGLSEAEKEKKKGGSSPRDFRGMEALLTAHLQNPDRNFYLLQLIQAPIYGCLTYEREEGRHVNKIRH